jgi:hypothetical protein
MLGQAVTSLREASDAQEPRFESLLPVKYSGGMAIAAAYLISSSMARAVTEGPKLHPIVLPGNRSVAVVTLFDFVASSIGPYRELSIGVLASPVRISLRSVLSAFAGSSPAGAWILALPVSSPVACRGGIELFGYPKSLEHIDAHVVNGVCTYSVGQNGQDLVSCDLPMGLGLRIRVRQLVTYSSLNGRLIETKIPVSWSPTLSSGRGVRMRLGTSDHPLTQGVRRLGLPDEPIFLLHGGGFEATLNAGNYVRG